MINETIVALATPNMKSAISIIRLSGPESIEIVSKFFTKDLTVVNSHSIHYGFIMQDGKKLDEVLVSVFRAPRSYTCEDVVEINTHGGIAITRKILNVILSQGVRLAKAGEFSQRAYLNGRIDLLEVEAINEIIEATTDKASQLAMSGLSRQTTNLINKFKESLLQIIAQIEVNIDYPEYDDVKELTHQEIKVALTSFKNEIVEIINNSKTSNMIKNGVKVAIIGRPNAGKSSLLNAFLEQDKAIVTEIAGTTRDVVEAEYILNGINLIFLDTAGIRDTEDKVERLGIKKSLQVSDEADLIILVLDNSETTINDFEKELIKSNDPRLLVVLNKTDLNDSAIIKGIRISALTGAIDDLKAEIIKKLDLNINIDNEKLFLSNQRHLALLNQINMAIDNALGAIENEMPADIIVSDLEEAYDYLQELLGQKYKDSLLDELFSRFCLGK